MWGTALPTAKKPCQLQKDVESVLENHEGSSLRILVVEDEIPIARYILKSIQDFLPRAKVIACLTLEDAQERIANERCDLCFLDLNLGGQNGFDLLKSFTIHSFHTIIISANVEKAITAFEFGVLDFIGKPFTQERLGQALERFFHKGQGEFHNTKFLTAKDHLGTHILPVASIHYFKGAGIYVEAHLEGRVILIEKPLDRLEQILSGSFVRIHKSYLVALDRIQRFQHIGGGKYRVWCADGTALPLSRNKVKWAKKLFSVDDSV